MLQIDPISPQNPCSGLDPITTTTMRTLHFISSHAEENLDLISTLPDAVCRHIVSFLPAKNAVATSVLSTRWRDVWASSPSLDFDFTLFPQSRGRKQAFANFVDRALHIFAGSELRTFRLSMEGYGGPEPRLENWVGFAVSHEVQELELCIPRGRQVRFPDSIFACESLTALRLRACKYTTGLPAPEGLQRLRTLHLVSISLLEGRFLEAVFAKCSLLEDLLIEECKIDVLEIRGEKIKSLAISSCEWVHPVHLKVATPSLRRFSYSGRAADDHSMEELPSLQEVVLELNGPSILCEGNEGCRSRLIKLLQMLGYARALTLSPWCTEQLSRAPSLPRCLQAQGENVKSLVLLLGRKEDSVQAISPLLSSCFNVEILELCISMSRKGPATSVGGQQQELGINVTLKELKMVKLEYIDVNKTGLEVVKFLLGNAGALEKMTIILFEDGLEQVKFRQQVSLFRRASQNVVVEYQMAP